MTISKRNFIKLAGAAGTSLAVSSFSSHAVNSRQRTIQNITGDVSPITVNERIKRIKKAQELMANNDIDAIILEPGSAMLYFTGIRWRRSERLTAIVIPREGDIAIVTPFFEEPSVRESMTFSDDVRPWHEHESPFKRVVDILKDRGIKSGKVGFEDTVRYFVVEGLKKASPDYEIVSALPVTLGCRMFKSEHEIALMRKANEITLKAYDQVYNQLEKGMTPADVRSLMGATQRALGGENVWALILMGEASAYPHGTNQPQIIEDGQVVLMDCGCSVHGYQSDISRTFVFGEPNKRQKEVWNTVKRGQEIAFATAQVGTSAGAVDDAVRCYYETLGYGPGYKTPGLSHRTGHGIGMDGHESVNFVHGEETELAPGMCFSNEPGLYIFGEFGVRLEDCIYMTAKGPVWFTVPPASLDDPIGHLGPVKNLG
jgi:Xaa-Pro dipeptidase